jgi:phosphatidylserine/phosphatidylglycerophosphate/cardiolipin synthase-like enzyme
VRKKVTTGSLSVNAIAGAYVVFLGIDMPEAASKGLLGFAIERIDHTEDERYWLRGLKTFAETDPGLPPGTLVSTLEQPVQGFQWGDYTAKPKHDYTYRIVALTGKPKNLVQGATVEIRVTTEDVDTGTHAIHFNRGVAASQAYARKFNNLPPDQVPDHKAYDWLSRGLFEALLGFIGQAQGKRYALRAAVYEFQYPPVLAAFKTAHDAGADVKIIFDAKSNSQDYPHKNNRAALTQAGIIDLTIPRTATPSFIAHNKFIILLDNGKPVQVWTGSTNIKEGGIFGHSNVGHIVRDEAIAASYLAYWQELSGDPEAAQLRPWSDQKTPVPSAKPKSMTPIFSPRSDLSALQWYADRMAATQGAVFFTAAFGINKLLQAVLEGDQKFLRYILLEKTDGNVELLKRNLDNQISIGAVAPGNALDNYMQEKLTGLNEHVKFVHTKYMLIDPLSDHPLVISGSANFSDASTKNNDENMLIIQDDPRVADIYLGEFMRLFTHFYTRDLMARQGASSAPVLKSSKPAPSKSAPGKSTGKPQDPTVPFDDNEMFRVLATQAATQAAATKPAPTKAVPPPAGSAPTGSTQPDPAAPNLGSVHLVPNDSWRLEYYKKGGPKFKERVYFAGK